jgi:hypothetical protein
MSEKGRNYACFRPCGCMCAVAHIDPEDKDKALKREVAKWIAAGDDVRQVTTEYVQKESRWGCEVCKPGKKMTQRGLDLE